MLFRKPMQVNIRLRTTTLPRSGMELLTKWLLFLQNACGKFGNSGYVLQKTTLHPRIAGLDKHEKPPYMLE